MDNIKLIESLYGSFAARDYETVMSHFADDIVWIAADNSPLADQSPYRGVPAIRSGVFDRIAAGFEKLIVVPDETFEADNGRVIVLGYYHGRFSGADNDFKTQVAHIWTIRDGRAVKFQQYLDTLQIARDAGAV